MDIEAPIIAVTVYTDRAQITRRARVTLVAGAQELVLTGLPTRLDTDSVRASGQGTVPVQIMGVESRERFLTQASQEKTRVAQTELEAVQDAGKILEHRDETLERRAHIVSQLADSAAKRYASALAEGKASLEAAAQFLDFVTTQTNQVNEARIALEKEKRENRAQQYALSSRINQSISEVNKSDRCVSVALEAQSAGEWELEVTYTMSGASWKPLYDIRVVTTLASLAPNTASPDTTEASGNTLSLGYGALLSQKTGEDWNEVKITLSTARPGLGTLPPKLDPIYVDAPRPVSPPMAAPMVARAKGRFEEERSVDIAPGGAATMDRMEEEVERGRPILAQEAQAEVEQNGATVIFGLPRPLSVPSNGQPHRAPITAAELPAQLDYLALPRRVSLAYLRATATNATQLTLLEGEANVFRDGTFAGKTHIAGTAPNGELKLFLGPDEGVRTERELTLREVDKTFMGNQRRVHFAYQLTVQSLKTYPVRVTVQDQIPVSRSEQIKVKLRGADPQPQVSDLGILTWELTLRPNEKRILRYDYGVEAPRDLTVTGLND